MTYPSRPLTSDKVLNPDPIITVAGSPSSRLKTGAGQLTLRGYEILEAIGTKKLDVHFDYTVKRPITWVDAALSHEGCPAWFRKLFGKYAEGVAVDVVYDSRPALRLSGAAVFSVPMFNKSIPTQDPTYEFEYEQTVDSCAHKRGVFKARVDGDEGTLVGVYEG